MVVFLRIEHEHIEIYDIHDTKKLKYQDWVSSFNKKNVTKNETFNDNIQHIYVSRLDVFNSIFTQSSFKS